MVNISFYVHADKSIMASLIGWLEADNLAGQLLRAVRQGFYFGIETRVPYAIVNLVRPKMFNKKSRPILGQIKYYADQVFVHGWIIARIAVIYKFTEYLLARFYPSQAVTHNTIGGRTVQAWHTLVAGALAGYLVMVRDKSEPKMKQQINMAIGIRTIFALASYCTRKGWVPGLADDQASYESGRSLFYVGLWALVMWHWRHQTVVAPGEMGRAQVNQMNMIYTGGDEPGKAKWVSHNYLIVGALSLLLTKTELFESILSRYM